MQQEGLALLGRQRRQRAVQALRRLTGQKAVRFDPTSISDRTLMQYLIRLSTSVQDREAIFGGRRGQGSADPMTLLAWALDPVGEWFLIRFDDSPVYGELAKLQMRYELDPDAERNREWKRETELVFQMPVTVGVDIKNPLVFAGVLTALRAAVMNAAPNMVTWETLPDKHKDVSIVRIQATPKLFDTRSIGPTC